MKVAPKSQSPLIDETLATSPQNSLATIKKTLRFMKKGIVLNFWYALLLLIGIRVFSGTLGALTGLIFKDLYDSNGAFKVSLNYLEYLLYVPIIFWFLKKTNTNIKESLFIPSLSTVISMMVVVFLYKSILTIPLFQADIFFESLINSKLRIFGGNYKPFFLADYIYSIIFVPIIEELFFSGLILKNFLKKYSPVYAILLSSLLFGAHHLNIANLHYFIIIR